MSHQEASLLSPADLIDFNAKDTIENQIYFRLSIQIESAEESTAKQPEGPHWKSICHVREAASTRARTRQHLSLCSSLSFSLSFSLSTPHLLSLFPADHLSCQEHLSGDSSGLDPDVTIMMCWITFFPTSFWDLYQGSFHGGSDIVEFHNEMCGGL